MKNETVMIAMMIWTFERGIHHKTWPRFERASVTEIIMSDKCK